MTKKHKEKRVKLARKCLGKSRSCLDGLNSKELSRFQEGMVQEFVNTVKHAEAVLNVIESTIKR